MVALEFIKNIVIGRFPGNGSPASPNSYKRIYIFNTNLHFLRQSCLAQKIPRIYILYERKSYVSPDSCKKIFASLVGRGGTSARSFLPWNHFFLQSVRKKFGLASLRRFTDLSSTDLSFFTDRSCENSRTAAAKIHGPEFLHRPQFHSCEDSRPKMISHLRNWY